MATQTVIQYLEEERYSSLPGGASEPIGPETMNRRQIETFIANGAITAGDVVAHDATKTGADRALYVIQAANVATGNGLACGVAITSAAGAGDKVDVVIAGYVEGVNCTAGTIGAANIPLSAGKTAAGEVDASAAGDLAGCFAVSAEAKGATTANKVAVFVKKQF
jgi:hypothetical protein